MASLTLDGIRVAYGGDVVALDEFSLEVEDGELVVLLGASGSGKSTVLNSVAGLVSPQQGEIRIGDRVVYAAGPKRVNVPPNKRELGMVFQAYSLWPHLSVRRNVEFPLKARRLPTNERRELVDAALRRVRCDALASRHPGELSGGQQQRVALARAIAPEPSLLLFDEPLSNLDAGLRLELRDEIRALHERLHFTGVYVTHDQAEAFALADRLVVMRDAKVEQSGPPEEVYQRPASLEVARFLGASAVRGMVTRGADGSHIETAFGELTASEPLEPGPVMAAFFPSDVTIEGAPDGGAVVRLVKFVGAHREYLLEAGGELLNVSVPRQVALAAGDRVRISVAPVDVRAYPGAAPPLGTLPGPGEAATVDAPAMPV